MGWIRVEDTIFDHPGFRDDAERMTWLWMIHRAAYRDHSVNYRGRVVALKTGQFAMTIRDFAAKRGWSKSKVERFFDRLKTGTGDGPMIETQTETGVLIVTICNYTNYQRKERSAETETDHAPRQEPGHSRDSSETQREQIHNYTSSFSGCVAGEREADRSVDVSRETQEAVHAWKDATGAIIITPGDRVALAGAIERNGIRNILAAIEARKRSAFLSGKTGNWGGMPLKWLWDDVRLAEVLRGEHDRRVDDTANRRRAGPGSVVEDVAEVARQLAEDRDRRTEPGRSYGDEPGGSLLRLASG